LDLKDVPMIVRALHDVEKCRLLEEPQWKDPGKCILIAAVTGAFFNPNQNPNQPVSPDRIAQEAIECLDEGASSVHLHMRDPQTGQATGNPALFEEVVEKIKNKHPNVVLDGCLTWGENFEEVMRPAKHLHVTPINPTAVWIGSALLAFPPQWCKVKTEYCYEHNIVPQIAIYNSGDFSNAERWLIRSGILKKPYYWLILPSLPGCFSMNNTEEAMESLVSSFRRLQALDPDSIIGVCAAGRATYYAAVISVLLGGHVRIGMEDTIFRYPFSDEVIRNNAEEVIRIKKLIEMLGREVATPEEYLTMVQPIEIQHT
jgi:3-keto-5-aminohexanoate cleavage enzyme